MIVGASKMCYYLASELLEMGMSVKIIDQNEQRCVEMSERLPRALVIAGDGTDSELLSEEGIGQTDAFVAITGLDEANILMALSAAKQSGTAVRWWPRSTASPAGAGLRREHDRQRGLHRRGDHGADFAVHPGHEERRRSKVKTLHRIVDEKVEALEFNVTPDISFAQRPPADLEGCGGAAGWRASCAERPDHHPLRQ